jgi:hypothetical protein
MTKLKLAKLPGRTPLKITIAVSPDLAQALQDYAAIYRAEYGEPESAANLIPFMLGSFLESDKGFAKARMELPSEAPAGPTGNSRRTRSSPLSSSTPTKE